MVLRTRQAHYDAPSNSDVQDILQKQREAYYPIFFNFGRPRSVVQRLRQRHRLDLFIARLSSMNLDGTIHIEAAYFKYDHADILIGTQVITHKVKNIKHNPNVTVLIDTQDYPFKGVLIYGEAVLDYEDVIAKRASIFERYMPTDEARDMACDLANEFDPVVIRIKLKRVISYDYSKPGLI